MGRLSSQMGFETALFLSQSVSHVNNTGLFTRLEISCVMCVYESVFVVIEGWGKSLTGRGTQTLWAHTIMSTHYTDIKM